MINTNEISVVVQGAVGRDTRACLASIRKKLPGAEIILSTWNGSDVAGLDYDKLVLSQDPGVLPNPFAIQQVPNNVNRQLVSTQAGLKVAKCKYVLKLRTDLIIKNINFLRYFDAFPARNHDWAYFKHRVVISSLYSREIYFGKWMLFHPSDMWMFGLREDVCDYFMGTSLAQKFDIEKYVYSELWRIDGAQYAPEQYYCINWIKRHKDDVNFTFIDDITEENIDISMNVLYNNFVFIGGFQSGIISYKHLSKFRQEYSDKSDMVGLITYELFQKRYREYCDADYQILAQRGYWHIVYKFIDNVKSLCVPFKSLVRYIITVFRCLYYLILLVWMKIFRKG